MRCDACATLTFRFRINISKFWESTYANENIIQWLDIICAGAITTEGKTRK
jgi:hypothetical protein